MPRSAALSLCHPDTVSGTTILDDGTRVYWTEGRSSPVLIRYPDGRTEEITTDQSSHWCFDIDFGPNSPERDMTLEEAREHDTARNRPTRKKTPVVIEAIHDNNISVMMIEHEEGTPDEEIITRAAQKIIDDYTAAKLPLDTPLRIGKIEGAHTPWTTTHVLGREGGKLEKLRIAENWT